MSTILIKKGTLEVLMELVCQPPQAHRAVSQTYTRTRRALLSNGTLSTLRDVERTKMTRNHPRESSPRIILRQKNDEVMQNFEISIGTKFEESIFL
jgi:hypothetical protein